MEKPILPSKPNPPKEPSKFLAPVRHRYSIYDGISLKQIIDAIGDIDPSLVAFSTERGYYDDFEMEFSWHGPSNIPDPRYEEKMVKFNKALNIYHEHLEDYDKAMLNYKIENKLYLQWFHADQLKKLKE